MESHNQEIKIDMKLSKYKILIKELTNEIHSLEEPQSQELILELAKELAKNLSQEINEELTVDVISNWFILTPQHRKVGSELLSLILRPRAKLFCFQAKLGN